jgi:low affinity Fe/Cu permease
VASVLARLVYVSPATTPSACRNRWRSPKHVQLVINTGQTIVTFLMVFLIQNSQNRDNAARQVKRDELVRVSEVKTCSSILSI